MSARFIVADVFDGLAAIEDGTVDLVVTSPPFIRLRSYLPADHPDKDKEIGHEATPAEFLDTLLAVTAELRRVLAPHGSICVELGDTYAGSGGGGGDLIPGSGGFDNTYKLANPDQHKIRRDISEGWPLAKSKALIPELYRVALAYGINPLTGQESPAGRWRIRNVVTWCKPNPAVGALGDKWRPATSDIVVACTSERRYWDDIATRYPSDYHRPNLRGKGSRSTDVPGQTRNMSDHTVNPAGAPLLDWWEIPPGAYKGSHYAVYPPALVEPLIKAMAPPRVCRTCGEPSRRIVESNYGGAAWTDCGHNTWRPAVVLDPFVGSGTTLAVATGHGHDAIGIDLDERNYQLALERVGPMLLGEPERVEGHLR